MTFLGTGPAALAAGSSGVLAGGSEDQEAAQSDSSNGEAAQAPVQCDGGPSFFRPIGPSDADDVVLPEGLRMISSADLAIRSAA